MSEANQMLEIKRAVERLEKRNRHLSVGFYTLLFLFAGMTLAFFTVQKTSASNEITPDSILRVRGLIIVDPNGKERVQIGSPLPDPLLLGKRYRRQGAVSGILMLDAEGNERSGYFTSDEPGTVALTLDTVAGQTAMFLANDETGANIQMHDYDNDHHVGMYAVDNAPSISVVRYGKKIFELPETKEKK